MSVLDKSRDIYLRSRLSQKLEEGFIPKRSVAELMEKEKKESHEYRGRSMKGKSKTPTNQLSLCVKHRNVFRVVRM